MNQQIVTERRVRKRTRARGRIELVAGDTRIPAELIDISFVGLRCRVAPSALAGLPTPVEAVRLEDLPAVTAFGIRTEADEFAVLFDEPQTAGPVIAAFLELFVPPEN